MTRDGKDNEVTSECPDFRRGWDIATKDCQDCKKWFSEEYEVCKEVCEKRKMNSGKRK